MKDKKTVTRISIANKYVMYEHFSSYIQLLLLMLTKIIFYAIPPLFL